MKWFGKHKVLTVILVLIVLGVIGAASGGNKGTTGGSGGQQSAQPSPKPKLDITSFYSQVGNGMTKAQVVELAGKNAGNCTESETQGLGKYEYCNWYGSLGDNAFASVVFKDDQVQSKSKTGF